MKPTEKTDFKEEIKEKDGLPLVAVGYKLMGLARLGEVTLGEFKDFTFSLLEKVKSLKGNDLIESAEMGRKLAIMSSTWGEW